MWESIGNGTSDLVLGVFQVYVQDLLQGELEAKVYQLLHTDGGHLYVCGDVRMARDVAQTLTAISAKYLSLTEEQAKEHFFQLKVKVQAILCSAWVTHCPYVLRLAQHADRQTASLRTL